MEAKSRLLGVLHNKLSKIVEEICRYMVTAARKIYTTKQKPEVCPCFKKWKNKLAEYSVMAKLTSEKQVY